MKKKISRAQQELVVGRTSFVPDESRAPIGLAQVNRDLVQELARRAPRDKFAFMSDWLWTWGGTSFGYREGNSLFTHSGVEAGHFHDNEIYGSEGNYIGELRSGKLVTRTAKQYKRRISFSPQRRIGVIGRIGQVATISSVGFEEFPHPDSFQ